MKTRRPSSQHTSIHRAARDFAVLCLLLSAVPLLQAQRATVATRASRAIAASAAIDAGQLAVSEPLRLTVRLEPTAAQSSALAQLLAAQTDSSSPSFHHWLTPAQFAARFGATDEQLATLRTYLEAHGLAVASISPTHTRLKVTGTAGQAQLAFATSLHRFTVNGTPFYANASEPTLSAEIAPLVAGISGLDDLPGAASARISLGSAERAASPRLSSLDGTAPEASGSDALDAIADAVDANASPILTLASTACSPDLAPTDQDAYRALLQQANAEGVTVLSASGCEAASEASFPASLPEVTALTTTPRETATASPGLEPRPDWQAAPGLPGDGLRHEPDLATSSVAAFAQTISTLNLETGNRLGNINATLYALAKTPGLFTQPDATPGAASAGNWEAATGLGLIDLNTLLKVYPRTAGISTSVSLISSSYLASYGSPFTLTSVVQVTAATPATTPAPTGTVTFTASSQGIIGSSTIDNTGTAMLASGLLPVGAYTLTATYSGDANYAPSTSVSKVVITVQMVNATLAATISPITSVPYGATATVTATVTLPNSSAAPSGSVSAQIIGVTGATFTNSLSPNTGTNSATGNISVSIPPAGSYTVQVTCQGSSNFQCQTPVNLNFVSVKGYSTTSVSVSPAAPQAGQPITLTATVGNSGNGKGSYIFSGTISFFDSGKLIASVPVASNQATTSTALSATRMHNITAAYSGDSNWNSSSSAAVAVLPTILPNTLTISTNLSGQTSLTGINIIFTGNVSTTVVFGSGPTGTLTFYDTFNNAVVQLGSPAPVVANGPYAAVGVFTTTGLQPGIHRIYAQYSGDESYAPSTSQILTLSASDFSLNMSPSTLMLSQGKSAQVGVLVAASGGFTGSVSLGCTPPSGSEATCAFSPSSVNAGETATLSIVTTATLAVRSGPQARLIRGLTCAGGVSLASLFFFFLAPRRRRIASLLLALVAVCLTANLGCAIGSTQTTTPGGNGGGSTPADPGTPLGTQNYTITAAGSDGVNTVRHTIQYQVTVQ